MGKKRVGKLPAIRVDAKSSSTENVNNVQLQAQKVPSSTNLVKVSSNETLNFEADIESPLEKLMNKAHDEASLKTFIEAWNKSVNEKLELRKKNTSVSYEEFEKLISSKKLDSNLKKCTGFVRKMRQYNESQKTSIENDIKTLNLSKYLSEVATALTESRFKISEVQDVIQICSWIHQRYSDFASLLLENLKKNFPLKKSDLNGSLLSKLAVDIRLIADLVVCGILPSPEGPNLVVNIIRNLISLDKEGTQCIIPILSFCRGSSDDFVGLIPLNISNLLKHHELILIQSDVFSCDKKIVFRSFLKDYFSTVLNALLKLHDGVQKSELLNRKMLRSKGEIPLDRKEAHMGLINKFEKFHVNMVKLADALGENLEELPSLPADPEEEEERAMLIAESGEELTAVPGIIIFEDEETRSFYQDFKDLKVHFPPGAYRENIQQTAELIQAIEEKEKDLDNFDDAVEEAELQGDKGLEDDGAGEAEGDLPPSKQQEKEDEEIDKQIKPSFQVFLNQLPNCVNRNMIDKAAIEFAENFNTKPNRKKLVQILFKVPRQRLDLIAFYSRFVAILNPVMPDIGLDLCHMIKNDFRFLVRKKHQIFIETKNKITRFIGELVNFKIFPKSEALQCLKILLMSFVHHQVEMACVFVETCGRFLYRTPDSHRRMKIYLEEMMRKKTVKSLEPRYVSMIDHAYFFVIPPEGGLKVEKIKPPLECYLEQILINDLNRDNLDFAISQLVSLDWGNEEIARLGITYLTMPWKIKFQQFPLYAELLVGLLKYEADVVTLVIDILIEEIRRGLEHPVIKNNHRRISTVNFLSEMYYLRLIGTSTMFNVLYLIVTYGVSLESSKLNKLDPPDNLFRIRLVCFILRESGSWLNSKKKKLKAFLTYFQVYFWFKRNLPLWNTVKFPYGIQELFEEVIREIFPNFKLVTSLEEAEAALKEMDSTLEDKLKESSQTQSSEKNTRFKDKTSKPPGLEKITESLEEMTLDEEESMGCVSPDRRQDMRQDNFLYLNNQQPVYYNSDAPMYNNYPQSQEFNIKMSRGDGKINENLQEQTSTWDPYYDGEPCEELPMTLNDSLEPTKEEDEEFSRLLDTMCAESYYNASSAKNMKADISIPLQIQNSAHSSCNRISVDVSSTSNTQGPAGDSKTVPFVLITRKGKKQEYKTLEVPADSDFVQRIRNREEAEKAEKESVKRRTLAINQIQEAEEREREKEAIKFVFEQRKQSDVEKRERGENDENENVFRISEEPDTLSANNKAAYEAWIQIQRERGYAAPRGHWRKSKQPRAYKNETT